MTVRGAPVTTRERAAYHEAGHVVGWLSAPFAPPDIYGVTIEPDRLRALTGEVRQRMQPRHDPRALRLAVGRALSRGKLTALTPALAELSAQVRAHVSGPVAEAIRIGASLPAIEEGECDYWNAYELCATVNLDPDATWRAESRRARRWLRRHWDQVRHVADLLLRQRRGRRTLAGAALKSVLRQTSTEVTSPYGPASYDRQARAWLTRHRAHWRRRDHWVVLEVQRPRGIAVAWSEEEVAATSVAAELSRHAKAPFEVQRRKAR